MKNFVSEGETLTITSAGAVLSGAGVLVGSLFGIANGDIAAGGEGVLVLEGVFDIPKVGTQAWTQGVQVYWDNTAKVATTVVTANTLIGAAVLAVASGATDTVGRVRLNGTA